MIIPPLTLVASKPSRSELALQFAQDIITLNNRVLEFLRTPIPNDSTAYLFYVSVLWELRRQVEAMTARAKELQKFRSQL